MERTPLNPHAFDEIKLHEDVNQKIIDRFTAFQTETRHRVDTLIKSIFVLSGGALTISIGVFLRKEAPALTPKITELLQYSWCLLFFSLAAAAVISFVMIVQGYYVGELWKKAQETGKNEIETNCALKLSRILNWFFGITGFISFLVGLSMLAIASTAAIGVP
jgi:hypothetical protein